MARLRDAWSLAARLAERHGVRIIRQSGPLLVAGVSEARGIDDPPLGARAYHWGRWLVELRFGALKAHRPAGVRSRSHSQHGEHSEPDWDSSADDKSPTIVNLN